MPRVAIVTDSNSGIRQSEAAELRVHVLPMPFTMDGESHFEDITLNQEMFYIKQNEGTDISTSQPSPGSVMDLWSKLLESHNEIVHIPMSSALSASCESAVVLSKEYEGRVQVVDNKRISVTLRQAVLDAVTLADAGRSAAQIKDYLEKTGLDASIYILMDTLQYLKKGGRITPAAAAIGTILNIKPVLQIQGGKLDSYAKARGTKQGRKIMIEAIKNDLATKFAPDAGPQHMWLYVVYSDDAYAGQLFKQEVEKIFPGYEISLDALPLSVACHIGPGAMAIACCKKLKL